MKVALVHDYIKEYGGAERVLEVLTEIFPDAPIYTAFYSKNSIAFEHFKDKKIITSWVQNIPLFATKLHSPLRFLAPLIWGSFDFSSYDLVISSASWYITKGFGKRKATSGPVEVCYCHTPPRWLYGYATSVNFQKYPIVKAFALVIGHFMRLYDFRQAQKVDYFVANSKETAERIKKFYRRDAAVIYPPATLSLARRVGPPVELPNSKSENQNLKKDYYLIVSRLVGGKGIDIAIKAAKKYGFKLKIAGSPSGYGNIGSDKTGVEFLGHVSDMELSELYKNARAFLALSKDEDFGITPVEAMSAGTPVIAFNSGGYKETVIHRETGVLFDDLSAEGLHRAMKQLNNLTINPADCIREAEKFSKERFKKEILTFITKVL